MDQRSVLLLPDFIVSGHLRYMLPISQWRDRAGFSPGFPLSSLSEEHEMHFQLQLYCRINFRARQEKQLNFTNYFLDHFLDTPFLIQQSAGDDSPALRTSVITASFWPYDPQGRNG